MKVNLFVSRDIEEPYADIHTNELTDNISKAMSILESEDSNDMLAVKKGSDIALLEFSDVYMFRVEDKQVVVYTENNNYLIKKPLYQVEETLGSDFVRISKSAIVNLKKVERVAPSLKGMMFIQLKNGLKDNISRKYLPGFKEALDL
ncbi:LytTR family DNA-binding domain-containing protein [uncultured Methanobrevibacter sp.]|jgi:DNA-binding LytR/AlgR family response regulator|uniref:LytTR family DNA-binding domain-containing protein n=1 Tax=uncultured Methanobrevibacter sp. TaxID=253161 RepID=UPI0025DC458B|nr:LytTR family DNA-binding domain-containing protein [uncultured Methanobrevibacter sp.]